MGPTAGQTPVLRSANRHLLQGPIANKLKLTKWDGPPVVGVKRIPSSEITLLSSDLALLPTDIGHIPLIPHVQNGENSSAPLS